MSLEVRPRKPNVPDLKLMARTLPSRIKMRMRRSSALISYTDISPEANPTANTSMAGDCAMEVMAVGAVDEDPIRRFDDENLCMQFLERQSQM